MTYSRPRSSATPPDGAWSPTTTVSTCGHHLSSVQFYFIASSEIINIHLQNFIAFIPRVINERINMINPCTIITAKSRHYDTGYINIKQRKTPE